MKILFGFLNIKYYSHVFILISCTVSFLAWYVYPQFMNYGISRNYVYLGWYLTFLLQIIFYQFLHWNLLHLLFNSYFLYQIWPEVESRMKRDEFMVFFLMNTLFVALSLLALAPNSVTVGISWFAMALLSYLFIDLYSVRHSMAWQLGFWLFLNVLTGFFGNISLVWHVSGAVFWILWWYLKKRIF